MFDEILRWLRTSAKPSRTTYLVHGERAAQESLTEQIDSKLGWKVEIPQHGQTVDVPLE